MSTELHSAPSSLCYNFNLIQCIQQTHVPIENVQCLPVCYALIVNTNATWELPYWRMGWTYSFTYWRQSVRDVWHCRMRNEMRSHDAKEETNFDGSHFSILPLADTTSCERTSWTGCGFHAIRQLQTVFVFCLLGGTWNKTQTKSKKNEYMSGSVTMCRVEFYWISAERQMLSGIGLGWARVTDVTRSSSRTWWWRRCWWWWW